MAIPDFENLMLPLLNYTADRHEHSFRETVEYLAQKFNLTEDERKELLPSGGMSIFSNRVGGHSKP
jgi:restriction system protein